MSIIPQDWLPTDESTNSPRGAGEKADKLIVVEESSSESWLEDSSSEDAPVEPSESASEGSEDDSLEDVVSTSSSSDA